jgi:hypothetical protein
MISNLNNNLEHELNCCKLGFEFREFYIKYQHILPKKYNPYQIWFYDFEGYTGSRANLFDCLEFFFKLEVLDSFVFLRTCLEKGSSQGYYVKNNENIPFEIYFNPYPNYSWEIECIDKDYDQWFPIFKGKSIDLLYKTMFDYNLGGGDSIFVDEVEQIMNIYHKDAKGNLNNVRFKVTRIERS